MKNPHILFRPPAEAESLIIRIADGCPWNQCTFCGMYKNVRYCPHSTEEIRETIAKAASDCPQANRVFLADGDVMALSHDSLGIILKLLNTLLPRLARVNLYANGHSILEKSDTELQELGLLKLNTLYMGLESGQEEILRRTGKRETAEAMIEAGQRAQAAGLKMSVMILTGLGGQADSRRHALATARALNRMQPRLVSALRVIPIPGTALHASERAGAFRPLTELQAVEELKTMIEHLELPGTVFRANHTSNILPLEGRLPRDKARLLDELDALLASGILDSRSPGPPPASL